MRVCLTLYPFVLPWLFCYAKVNVRHSETNKQFISQFEEGQFEIVHPFQVRDKKERIGIDTRNYFLNASIHYKNVVIVVRANVLLGTRLKLLLNLNDYIFFNQTQFRKLDTNGESAADKRVENCYYQGTVNGDPHSFVAISTCNGLRGIIAFDNGTALGIWPLRGGDLSRRHAHVLYRVKWTHDAACGAVTHLAVHASQLKSFAKRDVRRRTKHLELAVIGDYNFMKQFNFSQEESLDYIFETVNIADLMLSRDLNVRLSVVYLELWMDAQRVDIHGDIERTLSGTLDYVTGHIYHVEKDTTLMFTGGFFANNEVVSSTFSSICTARAVGLLKPLEMLSVHNTAQMTAHAVGHILGIDHDSPDCTCSDRQSPCVMNRQTGSASAPFSWKFSKCSIARIHSVLQTGHTQCLFNKPFQTSRLHQCGNGVVDGDEQCDCGRRDECFDPCCDPITCTLTAHAQCASHQPCCHRCELRKSGHVCRESRSVCDVPEVCDGESGNCPLDGYLVDGIACGLKGNCWKGNCSDVEQQCRTLWGPGAQAALDMCFDHNERGTEYSNCGRQADGTFISCSVENKKCGTLHCQGGSTSPIYSNLSSFNFQFAHEGQQVQCKAITNPLVGLVSDGTSCAPGKICLEGACLPLIQISPPVHCPSNNLALQCSGHGDCTTAQKCLCYDGYDGIACDIRTNYSRKTFYPTTNPNKALIIPSIRMGRTLETSTLLVILLVVGIFLLLLLVCLLFSYRRKSSTAPERLHITEKHDESFQPNPNSAVKFGQMPSYREEKQKQRNNKKVYQQLQKITEVGEPDSTSLKSRESTAFSSVNGQILNGGMNNDANHFYDSRRLIENASAENLHLYERSLRDGISDRQPYEANDRYHTEVIYAETNCMELEPSRGSHANSRSPTLSDYTNKRNRSTMSERNGYATDTEMALAAYGPPKYSNRPMATSSSAGLNHSGASSLAGSSCRLAPMPLKLSNIQMLIKQLNSGDENGDSEAELNGILAREDEETSCGYVRSNQPMPEPPPRSADSGHPGSTCDIRESPSLFSDPFKLEMSS